MAKTVGYPVDDAPAQMEAQVFTPGEPRVAPVPSGQVVVATERMWWSSGPQTGILAYAVGSVYPAEEHAMLATETEWQAHLRGGGAVNNPEIGNASAFASATPPALRPGKR